MLYVLPAFRVTSDVYDENGGAPKVKVIKRDPRNHRWNPYECDIVTFLVNMFTFFLQDSYSLQSRHDYFTDCLRFCQKHLDVTFTHGEYTSQLLNP